MRSPNTKGELQSSRFKQRKLIARKIGDELLLFDEETNTAHCLNGIAGDLWMACEREGSAVEVTEVLCPRWPDIEEEVVAASLSKLAAASLLEETTAQENISQGRRQLIRKLGFAAAVALPIVVTSVLIPPAAAAASPCGGLGSLCGAGHPPCCVGTHCASVLTTLVCVLNT
jgi:Coenzyme PQQ synthesis protein D (PqqD)